MITLATLVLVFALVLISVFLLASSIRWLITGRKPTLVLFVQAYQRWKNMATGTTNVPKSDDDVIDAEVKEISKNNQLSLFISSKDSPSKYECFHKDTVPTFYNELQFKLI